MASHRNWEYEDEEVEVQEENAGANRAIFLIFGALLLLVAALIVGIGLFGRRDAASERAISSGIVSVAAVQPTLSPEQVILQMTAAAPAATTNTQVVVEPIIPVVSLTTVPRPPFSVETPPSLVSGVLHGLISPFTFVLSLIAPTIRMYDPTNVGILYDIGFLIGVALLATLLRWWYVNRRAPRRRRA